MTILNVLIVTRWVHFASLFMVSGSALFWFYMGREGSLKDPGLLPRSFHATLILLRLAAPVAALSGIACVGGVLANMTDGFGNIVDPEILLLFFFNTSFGPIALLRLGLLAALVLAAFWPMRDRARLSALASIGSLLLISQAWLGHAAEAGTGLYGTLMISAYSVHVLAAAAWVGGLPPLLFALFEQRGSPRAQQTSIDILSRYSLMGMVAVTLIIISGLTNAGFRVAGSFGRLFYTSYGDVLFSKTGVVIAMLALAFFNRFVLMPELRTAPFNGVDQINRLRMSVVFELALGIVVLGAAAVLGVTPPPQ